MQDSGTRIIFPQVVYFVRFSHLVVRNGFYWSLPLIQQEARNIFQSFRGSNKGIKTQWFSCVHDCRLDITYSLCRLGWLLKSILVLGEPLFLSESKVFGN